MILEVKRHLDRHFVGFLSGKYAHDGHNYVCVRDPYKYLIKSGWSVNSYGEQGSVRQKQRLLVKLMSYAIDLQGTPGIFHYIEQQIIQLKK